ncbi:hypothetical protein V8B97DRAFT_2025074 [Scleroderma yunnanense]
MRYPITPSTSLPSLVHLQTYSPSQVHQALQTLKEIYFPQMAFSPPVSARPPSVQPPPSCAGGMPELKEKLTLCQEAVRNGGMAKAESRKKRFLCQERVRVPDSGYASAEEYDDGGGYKDLEDQGYDDSGDEEEDHLALLRADNLERGFSIKWLTGLLRRADSWINTRYDGANIEAALTTKEETMRMTIVDEASALLAQFAAGDDEQQSETALTREFIFPFWTDGIENSQQNDSNHGGDRIRRSQFITVELNDDPLDTVDHTAVGLQSWASAIILAQRMCADPAQYLLANLGAGTGLLSITAAKVYHRLRCSAYVKSTDFHPMVLDNLSRNVHANLETRGGVDGEVRVDYDIILAADVIYDPHHARWIRDCVARTMKKEHLHSGLEGGKESISVFWLAIPIRSIGRHEGMGQTVEDAFSLPGDVKEGSRDEQRLVIVNKVKVGKQAGVGRADEGGYTVFEIRWAY